MPSHLLAVAFEAHAPARLGGFWAGLLGREPVDDADGVLLPGDLTRLGLRFFPGSARKAGLNRMHLHLTSETPEHQRATVSAALRLGATHLDVGQLPEEGHVVLADPEDNEFCVIEAGNAYLAGCGFLGELTCDGTRAVGLFWNKALGWPLVWDEGDETAIQSPLGGTKVAWSGTAAAPGATRRQRFDLVVTDGDMAAEAERLLSLGATQGAAEADRAVVLADPDGMELWLRNG